MHPLVYRTNVTCVSNRASRGEKRGGAGTLLDRHPNPPSAALVPGPAGAAAHYQSFPVFEAAPSPPPVSRRPVRRSGHYRGSPEAEVHLCIWGFITGLSRGRGALLWRQVKDPGKSQGRQPQEGFGARDPLLVRGLSAGAVRGEPRPWGVRRPAPVAQMKCA